MDLNSKYFHYILISLMIFFVANGSNLTQNDLYFILFFGAVVVLTIRKMRLHKFMMVLIVSWLIINVITYFTFQNVSDTRLNTFLSLTAKILIPFLILKAVNKELFLKRIEKVIYFLAVISLVLYTFQILFVNYYYSIAPLLNSFTNPEQKANGGWYIFIYMFNGFKAAHRNSGFMWEPGIYSFMILVAVFIRFKFNNFKIDKKIFLYFIVILTTLSTTAYFVLFIIIIAMLLKYRNSFAIIIGIPTILVIGLFSYYEIDFLGEKIDNYQKYYEDMWAIEIDGKIIRRYNRFGILDFHFEESLKWPLGYGVFEATPAILLYGENVVGPNIYAQLLNRWGYLGIILFFFAVHRMINSFFHKQRGVIRIFLFVAFCSTTFSYNLLNNYFLLILLYYPFIKSKKLNYSYGT